LYFIYNLELCFPFLFRNNSINNNNLILITSIIITSLIFSLNCKKNNENKKSPFGISGQSKDLNEIVLEFRKKVEEGCPCVLPDKEPDTNYISGNQVSGYNYKITINPNIPDGNYSHTITAIDKCGNIKKINLKYKISTDAVIYHAWGYWKKI